MVAAAASKAALRVVTTRAKTTVAEFPVLAMDVKEGMNEEVR
jgi:hypothetical protein